MSEFFNRGVIDNPLNIKRISGDMPTSKSSRSNVFILLATLGIGGLTLGKVWAITLSLLKSPVLSAIVLVILYTLVIGKILSISVFEEKKQKKAYQDLLDNRVSDLSVTWEIQDIKEETVSGEKIAYIDYINGSRSLFLRCVPGPILNLDDTMPIAHYNAIQSTIQSIVKAGYTVDIHVQSESFVDYKALSFYYEKMRDFDDKDYIEVFTEQLDTIASVSEITSSIHVLYLEISGTGKHKHTMFQKLISTPSRLKGNTIFKEVGFINSKHDLDIWIAQDSAVPMFDRELLILNKYKGSFDTGSTAILSSQDSQGNILKQYNKDFDPKKAVRLKSVPANSNATFEDTDIIEQDITALATSYKPLTEDSQLEVSSLLMSELESTKDSKFIELMYSTKKVKIGD